MNENNFTIDINSLKLCFKIYSGGTHHSKENVQEAENYLAECKKDPNFMQILLQLFEDSSNDVNTRLVSFIQFKNLIREKWKQRQATKTTSAFSEEFKQQVRVFLVQCLEKNYEKGIRKQVDDLIKSIAATDFPVQYQELVEYFMKKLQILSDNTGDQNILMNNDTMNLLKTLKVVIADKTPKKIGDMEEVFNSVYFKYLQSFHKFWDNLHTNLPIVLENANSDNLDQLEHFLKVVRKADRIYLAFLTHGCEEMINNDDVMQIAGLAVQRALDLVKIVDDLQKKNQGEILEQVNKNLAKLLFSLSKVQIAFPLLFRNVLLDYLSLIEVILNNAEVFGQEGPLRAAVICLNSVVKCFLYYSDDVYILQKKKIAGFLELQRETYEKYHSYFNAEKIEALFQLFIVKILPRRKLLSQMQDTENFEDLIETEEEQTIDEFEMLDNPLYYLSLSFITTLLLQFPAISITIVHTICLRIVRSEVETPSASVLDGILSVIGLLPLVYRKKNILPSEYLEFKDVLEFLDTNGKQSVDLARRIPVLLHKWLDLFNTGIKTDVIKLVVELTKSINVYLIKYECLMCIKKALEGDVKLELDYAAISEELVPVIIDLLNKYISPQIVWGLISLLKLLFTKAQYDTQNANIINQIQSLSIEILTNSNYETLLTAVADMFKAIIASFPIYTPLPALYLLSVQFIDNQLSKGRSSLFILSLWLFVAKEYSSVQNLDGEMKDLFQKYSGVLLDKNNAYELAMGINIIEEYLLAGLIGVEDYESIIKIMENTYKKTMEQEPTEELFEVKTAVLGLFSSLLLIFLETNLLEDISIFENMIVFYLQDVLSNWTGPSCRAFRAFRIAIWTNLNRFIILNLNGLFAILQKCNVNPQDFIELWVGSFNSLFTRPALRLNALAIMQIIPEIADRGVMEKLLRPFVKLTIPEVEDSVEYGDNVPTRSTRSVHDRLRETCDSDRKEKSRQSNLYKNFDLKKIFIQVFSDMLKKFDFTQQEIFEFVNDEGMTNRFLFILESK